MILQIGLLILSIVALYYGAEFALESAEKIGLYLGFSPLVIGLLIVGFGTSLPEFFVSQVACFNDQSPMAVGNIVGSNVANLFLIMGLSGVMADLFILRKEIFEQFLMHLILTILLGVVVMQSSYHIYSSLMLVGFFVFYLWFTFKKMRQQRQLRSLEEDNDTSDKPGLSVFIFLLIGFSLLYGGGELLVYSGVNLGELFGVSTFVISAIFVAFGTSFPELVTSIVAIKNGKNSDLITGNLIGSNIFNVAMVMGSLGIYQFNFEDNYFWDVMTLLFAALFLILLYFLKKNFNRWSGLLFLAIYGVSVYRWISI